MSTTNAPVGQDNTTVQEPCPDCGGFHAPKPEPKGFPDLDAAGVQARLDETAWTLVRASQQKNLEATGSKHAAPLEEGEDEKDKEEKLFKTAAFGIWAARLGPIEKLAIKFELPGVGAVAGLVTAYLMGWLQKESVPEEMERMLALFPEESGEGVVCTRSEVLRMTEFIGEMSARELEIIEVTLYDRYGGLEGLVKELYGEDAKTYLKTDPTVIEEIRKDYF